MTIDKKDSSDNNVANVSQVTPNDRSKQLLEKHATGVIVVVCVLIGVFMLMPKMSAEVKKKDASTSSASYQLNSTLKQNLAEVERLKAEVEKSRKDAMERVMSRADHYKDNVPRPVLRAENDARKGLQRKELSKEILARMNAPSTFFVEDPSTIAVTSKVMTRDASGVEEAKLLAKSPDERFLGDASDITSVNAGSLAHPDYTVPAGELMSATLETAINSDLPGMVRAITTRDVYSLQDERLLIPRGSILVGRFNSGVVQGQDRALIVWERLQLNNGVIVSLKSPGTDSIGRSGQGADAVNRHFFQRFGTSALLSVMGYATATAGVTSNDQFNSASQFRNSIAEGFQQSASESLGQDMQIKPTLHINQGAQLNVFVAHDLSFYQVMRSSA